MELNMMRGIYLNKFAAFSFHAFHAWLLRLNPFRVWGFIYVFYNPAFHTGLLKLNPSGIGMQMDKTHITES